MTRVSVFEVIKTLAIDDLALIEEFQEKLDQWPFDNDEDRLFVKSFVDEIEAIEHKKIAWVERMEEERGNG